MARWAKMERFPVRVLGDKRVSLELTNTVGLMFCADAVEITMRRDADFETVMRGILAEYDATLSLRIPSLAFLGAALRAARHRSARLSQQDSGGVQLLFTGHSTREGRERRSSPDTSASLPWPPDIETLTQTWPRRSSPLFLHVMDYRP